MIRINTMYTMSNGKPLHYTALVVAVAAVVIACTSVAGYYRGS